MSKCIHKFLGNTGFRKTSCGMTQYSVIKSADYLEGRLCPNCKNTITFYGILTERAGKYEQ
ncbi:MAG: hypothetical protein IJF03_10005 [Lachnospiraceae bacterium]|nr:hypothetical protein [Lachnospiraceae bacterium]